MYITEDYNRYFKLSFPTPKRKLTEAIEIEELERLDTQIEKLKQEVDRSFFGKFDIQRDAIKRLRNDPEHSAFITEFEKLDREVAELIDSCYVESPLSTRYDPDYVFDQQAYEKIKDKVEPLKAKLNELRATYNELMRKASEEARTERNAVREPKVSAHKASTEARAKLFNQLLDSEKANIEKAVSLLNSSDAEHLSWDPALCTFRNRTLTVPVYTDWHEDKDFGYEFDDIFDVFGVDPYDGQGYSKEDYSFDEDEYVKLVGDRIFEDTGLYSDWIAEELSLNKTEGGYAILPEAGWVLDADFTIQLKEEPEITELETHVASHQDWWQTGESEGLHIDDIQVSNVIYRVVGYLTKKF